ncbi:MAG: TetR/AcrR family transcriptional regulator [Erysipelotrichaceae bacterium]|nr:TetR/AcrR family transcriptional regulator [Erysipelotrichaceae bacterium]
MAQFLKEEQRQAIIQAARQELAEKGYNDASMRSIAAKADMTVGNLYRYFKNKEEIQEFIVSDARDEINATLRELTVETVSKEPRVFNVKPDVNELSALLDKMAERLVYIYQRYRNEFLILLTNDRMNDSIKNWFSRTIRSLVDQHFLFDDQQQEREILTRSYALAINTGMKEIFYSEDISAETLQSILQIYLHSFIIMLDSDLAQRNDGYSFYHIPTPEQ